MTLLSTGKAIINSSVWTFITPAANSLPASELPAIGLYRDVWIAAIASSTTSLATRTAAICVRFQGRRVRRVYVTMQITFLTRKSALIYRRGLRQRVASLTLNCNGDFAIRAYSLLMICPPIAGFKIATSPEWTDLCSMYINRGLFSIGSFQWK